MKLVAPCCVAVALGLCLAPSALAANVENFFCKRVSGGPMSDLDFSVDFDAKMVDVAGYSYNPYDPSQVTITDERVEWSFMRGNMELDRKTGELVWDTTGEYEYLDAIGQPADDPESDYQGVMHCERAGVPRCLNSVL
jgi:hypothetical protein